MGKTLFGATYSALFLLASLLNGCGPTQAQTQLNQLSNTLETAGASNRECMANRTGYSRGYAPK